MLGCIDGTHIALKIAKKDQNTYRNRKGYDSLNVQAVCNASAEITQLTVKWPGSTHDSFIWRNCDLSEKFEAGGMPDGWLLGRYILICISYEYLIVNRLNDPVLCSVLVSRIFCIWMLAKV